MVVLWWGGQRGVGRRMRRNKKGGGSVKPALIRNLAMYKRWVGGQKGIHFKGRRF